MTTRTCPHCGTALAADAHPLRRFCSDHCRYTHRDSQPERKAADAERHRRRYHADPEHRESARERRRNAYRRQVGIPLDAPLPKQGRRRLENRQEDQP